MSFDLKKQEILDKTSIVEVVSEYLSLTQKGDRHWGLCPFHNEKTPSFSVTEDKNMFYCFGCHKGGNIFDFLIEIENLFLPPQSGGTHVQKKFSDLVVGSVAGSGDPLRGSSSAS